ncbi:MAG: hypothetical protein OES69_06175, partial [Myxococcales bacterium]|nr:hypothetical protein [Myxococcales bacterium]
MIRRWILVASTLLILAGCATGSEPAGTGGAPGAGGAPGTAGAPGTGGTAAGCATDIGVGEVQPFAMPTPTRTEGITFDAAGRLFVSALADDPDDDQLLEVMLDGTHEVAAEAESILGIASHPTGIIAAGIRTGDILRIDPDTGDSEVIVN